MKKVLVFAGSNSSTSINQMLVTYASTLLKNTEATVIELKDYPAPVFSEDIEKNEGHPETLKALNELFKSHDGFIICSNQAPIVNQGDALVHVTSQHIEL